MKDGDQIDFFTEQPGGRDSIKKNRTEAPYQIDGCQNFQRLGTVAQNQIGFMENAQPVADAEDNPGSQTAACLSSGNAEMQIIGGLSNGRVDSEQVRPHAEATGGAETAQADIAVASQLANQTNNLPSTGGVKMRHSAPGQYIQADKQASDARIALDHTFQLTNLYQDVRQLLVFVNM